MHLIVIHDFDGHKRGEAITDAATIALILASEHADHVVTVADISEELA